MSEPTTKTTELRIGADAKRHLNSLPKWVRLEIAEEAMDVASERGLPTVQSNHVSVAIERVAAKILKLK